MALKPVIDSRSQPFQIGGMPASKIFDASARKYGYDAQQFYAIAENLRKAKLIDLNKFGFYSPTARGEELIQEIFRALFPGEPDPGDGVPVLDLRGYPISLERHKAKRAKDKGQD